MMCISTIQDEHKPELLEAFFLFSLVWSVGALVDSIAGRKHFDAFLRERVKSKY